MAPEEKDQEVAPPVVSHQVVPPKLPQQTEGDQVVTQEYEKVFVPPIVEVSPK